MMNYYQFHIGDFNNATRHLDRLERSIYRDLLDLYYDKESPLPNDIPQIARKIMAREHVDIVESILNEFFTLDGIVWKNRRCDADIAKYQAKADSARRANQVRWASENTSDIRKDSDPNHKPITNNHKPDKDIAGVKTSTKSPPCPYQQIVDLYHEKLPMCPRVVKISDTRKRAIRARWNGDADNMDFWSDYFSHVAKSRFLTGRVDPPPGRKQFIADIDFLIRESTMLKTQEGKYHG
jgi:uncharacterized protein YdaU (DUF1376 family)